jgi:hypothetical protein
MELSLKAKIIPRPPPSEKEASSSKKNIIIYRG